MDRKKREEKVGYRSISRRVLRQNWEYIYKARIEKYIYTTDASSSDKDRCGGINIKHEIISTRAQPTCPDGFFSVFVVATTDGIVDDQRSCVYCWPFRVVWTRSDKNRTRFMQMSLYLVFILAVCVRV